MGDLMTRIKEFWAGRKTHALVILTIIVNALQHWIDGGDLTDFSLLIESLKLGIISTLKMGFDRLMGRATP